MLTRHLSILFVFPVLMFAACQSGQESKTPSNTQEQSNFHKITVSEVLQASAYTYLHAKENGNDLWLAVPSMQAKTGDIYYYEGGIQMTKFESKELNRVFESIILLEKLNSEPKSSAVVAADKPNSTQVPDNSSAYNQENGPATGENYTRKAPAIEKKEIKIVAASGGISIAELYAKKASYAGKAVKIKGQVTKFTPAIMGKNWIHIQDGTDANGKFDLTVTSDAEVKVGDVATFEGKIGLDKDLGYGYFFDVIMEDAKLKQ